MHVLEKYLRESAVYYYYESRTIKLLFKEKDCVLFHVNSP